MNRKKLQALCKLTASSEMIRIAQEDKPTHQIPYWSKPSYKYDLMLRAQVQDEILVVALFLPTILRLGGDKPAYELYIDHKEHKFLTFDCENKKWLTGKLDRINWGGNWWDTRDRWISDEDANTVRNYLSSDEGNYYAILQYQRGLREEELLKRHEKETKPWDVFLEQTPDLPKDWEQWVSKIGIPEHFVFYAYKRGGAETGYCTYCEKEVPVKKPRHNQTGRCPCCRNRITFKSIGRAGRVCTDNYAVFLMRQCKDGFMIREFCVSRTYPKQGFKTPKQHCIERRRTVFDRYGGALKAFEWGLYKQRTLRWIETSFCTGQWWNTRLSRIYGKTLPALQKRGLSRTGLMEYMQHHGLTDPEQYLTALNRMPLLEQIIKASLFKLTDECMMNGYSIREELRVADEPSLTKALGLDNRQFKRLRANNEGMEYIKWLRLERKNGQEIPDDTINWFRKEHILPESLNFIIDRMNAVQIHNYILRNMKSEKMRSHEVLTTWKDYLSMAERFGLNTNEEMIYRTTKLRKRHNELAKRGAGKNITLRAQEVSRTYPCVDEICRSLAEKYNFQGEKYVVIAPTKVEDILFEGDTLSHCISNGTRYWERIERHESYLLFLRKAEKPSEPYYTMEVEPGGTIRQIRTYGDEQKDDIEDARAFLRDWQAEISKRMTADDAAKARRSRVMREAEFVQMRKDHVKIKIGHLAGRLLVDVLTADLMESAAA